MSKCACIEQMMDMNGGYDYPFEQPIGFDKETSSLKVHGWHMRLYKKNSRGKVIHSATTLVQVNFCPICGERLTEIPLEEDK